MSTKDRDLGVGRGVAQRKTPLAAVRLREGGISVLVS